MYRHLDDDVPQLHAHQGTSGGTGNLNAPPQPNFLMISDKTIVTYGRICNMIAETSKELLSLENAVKFYLKGIAYEPGFLDNFIDFAQLCFSVGEHALGNLLLVLAKTLQATKDNQSSLNE